MRISDWSSDVLFRSRNERTPPMTEPTTPAKAAMPLHWKIGIGFFLGLVLGLIVYYTGLHEWTPVDLTSAACVAGEPAWYCAPVVEVIVHGRAGERRGGEESGS